MNTVHIYFQDEVRRIGSGWRTCEVKIKGSKVSLRECATDTRARIPLSIFETLRQREVKVRRRFQ